MLIFKKFSACRNNGKRTVKLTVLISLHYVNLFLFFVSFLLIHFLCKFCISLLILLVLLLLLHILLLLVVLLLLHFFPLLSSSEIHFRSIVCINLQHFKPLFIIFLETIPDSILLT